MIIMLNMKLSTCCKCFLPKIYFVFCALLVSSSLSAKSITEGIKHYVQLTGSYEYKVIEKYAVVSDLKYTDIGVESFNFEQMYIDSTPDPLLVNLTAVFESTGTVSYFKPMVATQFMSVVTLKDPEAMQYDSSLDVFTLILDESGQISGGFFVVHSFSKPVLGRKLHRMHRVFVSKELVDAVFKRMGEDVLSRMRLN